MHLFDRNGQMNSFARGMESGCFFLVLPSEQFESGMDLSDLLLYQFLGSQLFLVVVVVYFRQFN